MVTGYANITLREALLTYELLKVSTVCCGDHKTIKSEAE